MDANMLLVEKCFLEGTLQGWSGSTYLFSSDTDPVLEAARGPYVVVQSIRRLLEVSPPVTSHLKQLRLLIIAAHDRDHFRLLLKQDLEDGEFVIHVSELEQGRGVLAILSLCLLHLPTMAPLDRFGALVVWVAV